MSIDHPASALKRLTHISSAATSIGRGAYNWATFRTQQEMYRRAGKEIKNAGDAIAKPFKMPKQPPPPKPVTPKEPDVTDLARKRKAANRRRTSSLRVTDPSLSASTSNGLRIPT